MFLDVAEPVPGPDDANGFVRGMAAGTRGNKGLRCKPYESLSALRRAVPVRSIAPCLTYAWIAFLLLQGQALTGLSQQKRIYIAPDDHTDYVWTADEKTYEKALSDMTTYYLDSMDQTAGNPSQTQARWNFDGSLWMDVWERNKSPQDIARVVKRFRDGHLSMPLNYAVSTYGGMPTEAVLRSMYYSGEVERRYGLRFPIAVAMEDQTLPRGLASLFAGAGAKYSWRGVCTCATRMKPVITSIRPHEIYRWKGPDGSSVLMKWNSTYAGGPGIGTYLEARATDANVHFVEENALFRKTYPYDVIGLFGEGGDDLQTMNDRFVQVAKKLSTPSREVIVSNEQDFFADFDRTYGKHLPEVTTSFGNEWDTYSASMAELSASVRRATERMRSAEALATLVSLKEPAFFDSRSQARHAAWEGFGLYWEHDWTADSPKVSRDARRDWQRRTAMKVTKYVDDLMDDATEKLGEQIVRRGNAPRFFVFNALNWTRSDSADLPYSGPEEVHVVDLATGKTVPSQIAEVSDDHGASARVLRIWASDIPSVGYKSFEVVQGPDRASPSLLRAEGGVLENGDYRLTVNASGALISVVAKKLGDRELIQKIGGSWSNDWDGGEGAEQRTGTIGKIELKNVGPVSATVRVAVSDPLPRSTEITLFREGDRIEIRNEVDANFRDAHTWAFTFHLHSPDVWHEELGAINHAKLAPEGDYAATFSRLDWLTLNHFAAMSGDDGVGVTLSNWDAAFMKLGESEIVDGVSKLDTKTPQIHVLAGGQVDGPYLGIQAQGGDTRLMQRFALQVYAKYDAAGSMRFAMEHQNRLVAGRITGGSMYPEATFSLLSTTDPKLLLWVLKPSEEGATRGIVTRFWNMSDRPGKSKVSLDGGIKTAWRVSHIETENGPASVEMNALNAHSAQWQLQTFRLMPGLQAEPNIKAGAR